MQKARDTLNGILESYKISNDFNGGKMTHCFKIENNIYTSNVILNDFNSSDGYLRKYDIFKKIDGQCGAIAYNKDTGDFVLLTRYDDKRNKFTQAIPEGFIPIPKGKNMSEYTSNNPKKTVTHKYYFEIWPRPLDTDKSKTAKMRRKLYKCVDDMPNKSKRLKHGINTCEFVGPKFQQTLGIKDVNIALHSEQTLSIDLLEYIVHHTYGNVYEGFKELLTSEFSYIEGFIIKNKETGECFKIRQNVFTKEGEYEKMWKRWKNVIKKDKESIETIIEELKRGDFLPTLITDVLE